MSIDEELDCVVIFTPAEMAVFNEELNHDLSHDQLTLRLGQQLPSVKALYEIVRDPPPGGSDEYYYDYDVYADIKNPVALIIYGDQEDIYFRIPRPKDYSSVEDILQRRIDDILEEKRSRDDWAEDDYNANLND